MRGVFGNSSDSGVLNPESMSLEGVLRDSATRVNDVVLGALLARHTWA